MAIKSISMWFGKCDEIEMKTFEILQLPDCAYISKITIVKSALLIILVNIKNKKLAKLILMRKNIYY